MFEVCIDTGGTFTDAVSIDAEGNASIAKVETTHQDLAQGIMNCLKTLAERHKLPYPEYLANTKTLTLSTTVGTNALLELRGARVCMVTTSGFRDILEGRRMMIKPNIYNLRLPKPVVLVPRNLRFVVEERVSYKGEVLLPLNEDAVREAAAKCKANNAEAVAVCFLHSYANPAHEKRAGEILREELPGIEVVLSAEVLPRLDEFPRFATTVLAAYLGPICALFLRNLEERLRQNGFKGSLLVLTGNGAVTNVETAIKRPVLMLSSGPSAGPVFSTFLGKQAGFSDIIYGDMGGTSFDTSIIPKGEILTTNDSIIGDQRNASDVIDIVSIGTGGGSIARLDERGILGIGPESAAADPGPVCYGRGGRRPTVTDADVVLGYIPSDYFLGGRMKIDPGLAKKAIEEQIALPSGIDVAEVAYGIYSLLNTKAADAIFLAATMRGYDPRHFTLCIGGGAGPAHVFALAQRLGMKRVYIPKVASTFCACGIAYADFRYEFMRYFHFLSQTINLDEVNNAYQELEAEGLKLLKEDGVPQTAMELGRGADMRYYRQHFSIEASLPPTKIGRPMTVKAFKTLVKDFHNRHRVLRGYADETAPTEGVSIRLKAIGRRPPVKIAEQAFGGEDASTALKRRRPVYFKELGGFTETPCYDGNRLRNGNIIIGPAVIEEETTTVVVPARAKVSVDRYGNYVGELP
ncbi:hydantoinase/oxoprolinase family protein [Chloroflexota bacterium]